MSRIEAPMHVSLTIEVVENEHPYSAAARPLVMPTPSDAMAGIAEQIALLVLNAAMTQKKSARESEAIESAAQHVAEDRQIAEMRKKAEGMMSAAIVEGAVNALAGVVTLSSVTPTLGKNADAMRQFGEQLSNGSKVASGFGGATQTKHDANIEQQRAFAQRALRACDDAKRGTQDAAELASKALAFVREAMRTQADCNMASVRWG